MLKIIATASIVLTLVASGAAFAATRDMGMGTMVYLHSSSHGKVLATSTGRTLYLFTGDGYKVSHGAGPCATDMAAAEDGGKPLAGSMGVKQSLLSTLARPNGRSKSRTRATRSTATAATRKPGRRAVKGSTASGSPSTPAATRPRQGGRQVLKRTAIASIVLMLVASGAAFAASLTTGTKVTLHSTSKGKVLATSTGRMLYLSTADGRTRATARAVAPRSGRRC